MGCALGACSTDEAPPEGTVLVTFGQERGEWANVQTLRLERTDGASTSVLFEGDAASANVALGAAPPDASVTLVAEARNAAGERVARGRSATFSGQELAGATVPVQLSPLAGASRASAGLIGAWSWGGTSGATLLGDRYLVLANVSGTPSSDELYDAGLLSTLLGGPSWPRSPQVLLRATAYDLLVVDAAGASFTNAFSSVAPVTSSLSAQDSSALVAGEVLEGTKDEAGGSTGRWLSGPCARSRPGLVASDRVLHLTGSDALIVSRLSAPRLGAACAVSPKGSLLIAGGGPSTLAIVDLAGAITEVPLVDDRSFGAAMFSEDGSLLLLGGRAEAGPPAPPLRVAFPCGDTCVASPLSLGAAGDDDALADLAAIPSSPGHAFFVSRRPTGDVWLYGSSTSLTTSLVPLAVRVQRTAAYAFVLPGERLLVGAGVHAAGTPSTEVELLTPP